MTKREKLIAKIKSFKGISFDQAVSLLESLDYEPYQTSSSHITFRKTGKMPITLVKNQKELQRYHLKNLNKILESEDL